MQRESKTMKGEQKTKASSIFWVKLFPDSAFDLLAAYLLLTDSRAALMGLWSETLFVPAAAIDRPTGRHVVHRVNAVRYMGFDLLPHIRWQSLACRQRQSSPYKPNGLLRVHTRLLSQRRCKGYHLRPVCLLLVRVLVIWKRANFF